MQVIKERSLDFDPIKLIYVTSHRDCKYLIVAGSNRACAVYTLEGVRIATLAEQMTWIWSLAVKPIGGIGSCHMVQHFILTTPTQKLFADYENKSKINPSRI